MKLEYLIIRLLMTYDQQGNRQIYAVQGDAAKLGKLATWQGSLESLLDALGEQEWELTAGTTALAATTADMHLVLKRSKQNH